MGRAASAGQTFSVLQQGTGTPPFSIPDGGVVDALGYGPVISPGAYASIYPRGLAATTGLTWDAFVPDGKTSLTRLNGVSVKIDRKPANPSCVGTGHVMVLNGKLLPGLARPAKFGDYLVM